MNKIKSLEDLRKLRDRVKGEVKLREAGINSHERVQVKVAMGTCGIASGARDVMNTFIDELDKNEIDGIVTHTGCMGFCYAEPTVEVTLLNREPVVFGKVDKDKVIDIVTKYIANGDLVDGLLPINYKTI